MTKRDRGLESLNAVWHDLILMADAFNMGSDAVKLNIVPDLNWLHDAERSDRARDLKVAIEIEVTNNLGPFTDKKL